MAVLTCAWLVLICFVSAFCGVKGQDKDSTLLEDRLVVIGPPENVTAYFTGSTNIVVLWDPPHVYVSHDVENAFLDTFQLGDEVNVTQHQISLVAENVTDTSGSSAANNLTGSTNTTEGDSTSNGTDIDNTDTVWECKPFSYFSNYTVEVKGEMNVTEVSMVKTLAESTIGQQKQTISFTDKLKAVPFNQGCITNYIVEYEDVTAGVVKNMSVSPISRKANITGLKPQKKYRINVSALFVSKDIMISNPSIFVTTKLEGEHAACLCDWHGTVNMKNDCSISIGPKMCECKKGYMGFFCEVCEPGYYRTAPFFPCHRCPCDAHAARKSTCRFVEGFLRCDQCELGYTGNICHMCDNGFYRYNRHCVPCHCNGNTAKEAPSMCLSTTGACIKCQRNTTGFNCERCLAGYVGDPITFKNCTRVLDVKAAEQSFSPGVVAAIVVGVLLVVLLVVIFFIIRRQQSRERRWAFWTVEMKRDVDDVDINSVHNEDAYMDDADDVRFCERPKGSSSTSKYSRLQEQV